MRTSTLVRTLVVVGSVTATAVTGARADVSSGYGSSQPTTPTTPQPSGAPQSPTSGTPQSPTSGTPQTPTSGTQTPPSGQQPSQGPTSEAGGIVQLVDQALSNVNLRPDQKQALQSIATQVDTKVAAVDQAKRNLLSALADQIEAGQVNESDLQSLNDKFADAAAAASPVVRNAIQKLHDTLDPQQRKQFVDALRTELNQGAPTNGSSAMLDKLSRLLNLTQDQKQKIGQIFSNASSSPDNTRQRMNKLLDSFPSDQFSVDDVAPAQNERDRAAAIAKNMENVASEVTQVLTPEQRKTAADYLRSQVSGQSTQMPSGGTQAPSGGTQTPSSGAQTPSGSTEGPSSGEPVGSTSQGIWVGRGYGAGYGYGYGRNVYRSYSGYGFGVGYRSGWGGMYLI